MLLLLVFAYIIVGLALGCNLYSDQPPETKSELTALIASAALWGPICLHELYKELRR